MTSSNENFSALLAICPRWTPRKGPWPGALMGFFYLRLNKRLSHSNECQAVLTKTKQNAHPVHNCLDPPYLLCVLTDNYSGQYSQPERMVYVWLLCTGRPLITFADANIFQNNLLT